MPLLNTCHLLVKSISNNKWSICVSGTPEEIAREYDRWIPNYGKHRLTTYNGTKEQANFYIDNSLNPKPKYNN